MLWNPWPCVPDEWRSAEGRGGLVPGQTGGEACCHGPLQQTRSLRYLYIYVSIIIKFECHVNGSDEVYIYLLGIISVPVPWGARESVCVCVRVCTHIESSECHHIYLYICIVYIWLSAKRCANGGSDFWLSIKSISNTLSRCCFVCAFRIGQYHSGNSMSSKSGAAWEILFFESEKHHEIRPLKTDTLTVSAFDAFIHVHGKSKHYLSHWFAQRRYRFTQCI